MCEWLRERTLTLIEAFRSKECLWKTSSRDYTNRAIKNEAWEEVAKAAGCDVRSAEKKMKSLRTQFMCYYKETLRNAGSGSDDTFQPKWFAYSALKFLIQERISSANRDVGGRKRPLFTEKVSREDQYLSQCVNIEESEANDSQNSAELFTKSTSNNRGHDFRVNRMYVSPIYKKKKYDELGDFHEETYSFVNSVQEHSRRDEFVVFAEHIAHRLRKISDPHARLVAQHQINNILFEAEMAKFQSPVVYCHAATNTATAQISRLSPSVQSSTSYSNPQTPDCQRKIFIIEDEDGDDEK